MELNGVITSNLKGFLLVGLEPLLRWRRRLVGEGKTTRPLYRSRSNNEPHGHWVVGKVSGFYEASKSINHRYGELQREIRHLLDKIKAGRAGPLVWGPRVFMPRTRGE